MEVFNNIPKLGFGLMRLPMLDRDTVDIEQTKQMVDLFLESGFNYFDTAWGYLDGKSEEAARLALVDRHPRDSFYLATKLPAWAADSKQAAEQMLYTSLERTGAGYFDFYLLHNLGESHTKYFDDYDLWSFAAEKKAQGLIRHLGFSFHDKAAVLDELLCAHPEMEFVQLQINYADWENPIVESRKCYEVARAHGKPIIIMEPVKGGTIANPPAEIGRLFSSAAPEASPASWAIRFAASLEGVITVLSGMSDTEQMRDNISYMKEFKPLTQGEQAVIAKAQDILKKYPSVPCTACGYCMKGCPKNIAIYGTFQPYNVYKMYGDLKAARNNYMWNTLGRGKASECIKCGKCEQVCPQHIHIRDELAAAAKVLEK